MSDPILAPGIILKDMIFKNSLTVREFAKKLNMSHAAIYLVIQGKSRVSVPMAFRLARFFNTVPAFWLSAQIKSEVAEAEKDRELEKALRNITPMQKKAEE